MKSLKNTQGFSLVELMVVVAIIGILAALSVGQVTKQIAKSRQSEAKTNLASLYAAEKSLYAEFSSYGGAWNQLAFGLDGTLRYDFGFVANTPTLDLATNGYTGAAATAPSMASAYCAASGTCSRVQTNGALPNTPTTNAQAQTFIAEAHSFIFQQGTDDVWQINQNKQLQNTAPGIP